MSRHFPRWVGFRSQKALNSCISIIFMSLKFAIKVGWLLLQSTTRINKNSRRKYNPIWRVTFRLHLPWRRRLVEYWKQNMDRRKRRIYRTWLNFSIISHNKGRLSLQSRKEWWRNPSIAERTISKYFPQLSITAKIEYITSERGRRRKWREAYCCKLLTSRRLMRQMPANSNFYQTRSSFFNKRIWTCCR